MTTPLKAPVVLIVAYALVATLVAAASDVSKPNGDRHSVERAYVDQAGNVHVVENGGRDRKIEKETEQVGSNDIKIASDKKTVGWTALYENCCTSYPIALRLVIYKNGRVRRSITADLMIYDWRFWAGGKQVAFCSGTVHGDSGGHCELHDAASGRRLAAISGHLDENSPAWARGLQN